MTCEGVAWCGWIGCRQVEVEESLLDTSGHFFPRLPNPPGWPDRESRAIGLACANDSGINPGMLISPEISSRPIPPFCLKKLKQGYFINTALACLFEMMLFLSGPCLVPGVYRHVFLALQEASHEISYAIYHEQQRNGVTKGCT